MNSLQTQAHRSLLTYAVSRAMFCKCGDILDSATAALTMGPAAVSTRVECAKCYGRAPFCAVVPAIGGGEYTVLDGRALWPWKPATARRRTRHGVTLG